MIKKKNLYMPLHFINFTKIVKLLIPLILKLLYQVKKSNYKIIIKLILY